MDTKEITGWAIAALGIILVALSYSAVRAYLKIPALPVSDIYIMLAGAVILVVGGFLAFRARKSAEIPHEVPIYEGHGKERKVVAYQRMHKK